MLLHYLPAMRSINTGAIAGSRTRSHRHQPIITPEYSVLVNKGVWPMNMIICHYTMSQFPGTMQEMVIPLRHVPSYIFFISVIKPYPGSSYSVSIDCLRDGSSKYYITAARLFFAIFFGEFGTYGLWT